MTTAFRAAAGRGQGGAARGVPLGISGGTACLGANTRPNVTIGRALRLVMRNLGGAKPHGMEKSTQAFPGKITIR